MQSRAGQSRVEFCAVSVRRVPEHARVSTRGGSVRQGQGQTGWSDLTGQHRGAEARLSDDVYCIALHCMLPHFDIGIVMFVEEKLQRDAKLEHHQGRKHKAKLCLLRSVKGYVV